MITSFRWRRRGATALAALALALVPAAAPASAAPTPAAVPAAATAAAGFSHRELPEPPPAGQVRAELDQLVVEAPHSMDGYSRAKFPHWAIQWGTCDTREVVLARDGAGVVQDGQCRAVAGEWVSVYDDKVLDAASKVDIDHMVPLAAAWRSGADGWDTAKRKAFANDLQHSQLVAVSAASNRSKADKSPDAWRPPALGYWCTYARAWTDIKHVYGLSVTGPEKAALNEMLDTCA
ncbi:HNH endonuclease family protein [Kitasatospora saccharophila]|uniref:HNH endonuclease family protein n=1 Tax=Kitasatospora saccharophila TaxID=407973 RepID=A0ABN2XYW7_9ACTN